MAPDTEDNIARINLRQLAIILTIVGSIAAFLWAVFQVRSDVATNKEGLSELKTRVALIPSERDTKLALMDTKIETKTTGMENKLESKCATVIANTQSEIAICKVAIAAEHDKAIKLESDVAYILSGISEIKTLVKELAARTKPATALNTTN